MDSDEPVSMEIIPPAAPVGRRPDGTFLPGSNNSTHTSKHAFTKRLSEELGKRIDAGGPDASPLIFAHTIMMDTKERTIHRLYACKMLLRAIFPQAISLSMESDDPEALAVESKKVTETLTAYFGRKGE